MQGHGSEEGMDLSELQNENPQTLGQTDRSIAFRGSDWRQCGLSCTDGKWKCHDGVGRVDRWEGQHGGRERNSGKRKGPDIGERAECRTADGRCCESRAVSGCH